MFASDEQGIDDAPGSRQKDHQPKLPDANDQDPRPNQFCITQPKGLIARAPPIDLARGSQQKGRDQGRNHGFKAVWGGPEIKGCKTDQRDGQGREIGDDLPFQVCHAEPQKRNGKAAKDKTRIRRGPKCDNCPGIERQEKQSGPMILWRKTVSAQGGAFRHPQSGFVLLATLVSVMSLALIIGLAQARSAANQRLAAALSADLREGFARDAIHDRLRGLVADQMVATEKRADRPLLNGTPFFLEQQGKVWAVTVQDVDGLLDAYFTAAPVLTAALDDADRFFETRERVLDKLPPGSRFPELGMSLAQFGFGEMEADLFTQSTTSSFIRLDSAPASLARRLTGLPPEFSQSGQVQTVHVRVFLP